MVTRPRNGSNQRYKATYNNYGLSHKGRKLCCVDAVAPPADCLSTIADLEACDVLVEKVSGTGTPMEEGTYAFGCLVDDGYCRFYWVSPDGTCTFQLRWSAGSWSAFASYGGTAGDCASIGGTSLGIAGTSEATPDYDFWCNEIPLTIPTGGSGVPFYHFTLIHP